MQSIKDMFCGCPACGARILGHRGAAQLCGPRRRTPQDWNETRAKRAMWHGARRADKQNARGSATHGNDPRRHGRWPTAGQQGVAGGASRKWSANWARGAPIFRALQHGATVQAALLQAARPERDARSARCGMAQGKITIGTRMAASGMATPRDAASDGQSRRWVAADNRATRRCRRRITKTVCNLGARAATVRAASSRATRPDGDAREACYVAWCVARSQAASKGQRRARQHPATPRAINNVGRRRTDGQQGVADAPGGATIIEAWWLACGVYLLLTTGRWYLTRAQLNTTLKSSSCKRETRLLNPIWRNKGRSARPRLCPSSKKDWSCSPPRQNERNHSGAPAIPAPNLS